jgi:hypothetical protein
VDRYERFILMAKLVIVGVQRVTVSFPEETVRLVKEASEEAGLSVSAWLARAAEQQIAHKTNLDEVEAFVAALDIPDADWAKTEEIVARTLARDARLRRERAS